MEKKVSTDQQKGNSSEDVMAYSIGVLRALQAVAVNVAGHNPALKKSLEQTLDAFIADVPPMVSNPGHYRAALEAIRVSLNNVRTTIR